MKSTEKYRKSSGEECRKKVDEQSEPKNQGRLILDATCVPADIRYPNDLGLLNQAREQTERTIDRLYKGIKEKANKKPRTYRNKARTAKCEVVHQSN